MNEKKVKRKLVCSKHIEPKLKKTR